MNKAAIIIVSLVLVTAVGLGGCITINPPTETAPTTESAPAETAVTAPELVSPHNGATDVELTPRFLWKAVPEATVYELAVSLNSDFSHRVISVSMGDTAYQSPPDLRYYPVQEYDILEPATCYYWKVATKSTGEGWSPVWTFTTGTAAASSPPPEPTIDDIFLARWGHTYYNNTPRVSYDLDQIEKLLIEIVCQVPWQSYYKAGVFDCSEKSAYLEYVFERHGYTAEIAEGEGHAWVLVYNDMAPCWLSIEATLPVGTLNPPHPYTPTIGGIVKCNFNLERKWEDIYHVEQISEYDWWDSPLADLLVEASDKTKLR